MLLSEYLGSDTDFPLMFKLIDACDRFLSVVCLDGSATVDGEPMEKGDSFFLPAGLGEVTVAGRCEILVTVQG